MPDIKPIDTSGMQCARGLYEGHSVYTDGPFKGHSAYGVFSYVNVDGPCPRPVKFWCKRKGSNHAWLACDLPEHQKDAEIVLALNEEYAAYLKWQQRPGSPMPDILKNRVKRDHFLDGPKAVITVDEEGKVKGPPKALPPKPGKKRMPRNKGQKKPRTLGEALQAVAPKNRAEAYQQAAKTGVKILLGIMSLADGKADKDK